MKTRQLSAREAKDLDAELGYWYSYAKKGIKILPEDKINSVEDFIKAYIALCDVTQRLLAYIDTPAGSRYFNMDFLERFQSGVDMRFNKLMRQEETMRPRIFSIRAYHDIYKPMSREWNELQGKLTDVALKAPLYAEENFPPSPFIVARVVAQNPQTVSNSATFFGNILSKLSLIIGERPASEPPSGKMR